jgi:hypothetical protein
MLKTTFLTLIVFGDKNAQSTIGVFNLDNECFANYVLLGMVTLHGCMGMFPG